MILELPTMKFTWDNWGGDYYDINDLFYYDNVEHKHRLINTDKYVCIGYCHSDNLESRPRKRQLAFMFHDMEDDEEFWIHFPMLHISRLKQ